MEYLQNRELILYAIILIIGLLLKPWSNKRKKYSGALNLLGIAGWSLISFSALMITSVYSHNAAGLFIILAMIFILVWIVYEIFSFFKKK